MRIVLTNNFFLPRTSGSTHFTSSLATELTSRGHEVMVITCTAGDSEDDLGYQVVRLPNLQINLGRFSYGYEIPFCSPISGLSKLFRALSDFRPDAVHVNEQFFDISYWVGHWARRRGITPVMTIHTAFAHNVGWIQTMLRGVDATLVSPALALTDPTMVTIDKFIDGYVAQRFRHRRRRFVPIPVRSHVFEGGDAQRVRGELGIGAAPMILSLGHVIPLRDRLLLVEALPAIRAAVPDVRLVVVGKQYDTRYLELASRLGVRDAVVPVGEVPHGEVRDYVAAAHVECHETQSYGLGTASLEVMASGLPIAAVVDADNFPGLVLEDGVQLVRCDATASSLAGGIVRLLGDQELQATVSKGARELIAENFELARVADRYEELYQGGQL